MRQLLAHKPEIGKRLSGLLNWRAYRTRLWWISIMVGLLLFWRDDTLGGSLVMILSFLWFYSGSISRSENSTPDSNTTADEANQQWKGQLNNVAQGFEREFNIVRQDLSQSQSIISDAIIKLQNSFESMHDQSGKINHEVDPVVYTKYRYTE